MNIKDLKEMARNEELYRLAKALRITATEVMETE